MPVAHQYIYQNWDRIETGDVIDVEHILELTESVKLSERLTE